MSKKNSSVETYGIVVRAAGTDIALLSDVSFAVREGDWIAVAGKSGSGKSTLAKALAGVVSLDEGHIERSAGGSGRMTVQLVMQNPEAQTVGETVFEDVCFGMENMGVPQAEMAARAEEALIKVGLAGFAGRSTTELSGGQKQLLAIAGALAVEASVIVFDEATSMLDPASRERILRVVRDLHEQGTAIVWITQLLDELAFADRVVVLDKGAVVFEGDPRRFFYGSAEIASYSPEQEIGCDRFGFARPFAVETARLLLERGFRLPTLPLTPEQLAEAVAAAAAEGGAS
ncbi:ATP-binding cassette domain-containing protein [Paenibacillus sp. MBLB4367]|uniref:ATP-binding cassette domain-containing protein n=1 Tax=Paenibacillus sp. MBLB4367 TaxID=3384767 RepID=UPI003907ED59